MKVKFTTLQPSTRREGLEPHELLAALKGSHVEGVVVQMAGVESAVNVVVYVERKDIDTRIALSFVHRHFKFATYIVHFIT